MTGAGLHLIVRLAGERVALPASEVESVVEIDAPTPVPGTPAYVAGLAALRSRVLTVIDGAAALGLPSSAQTASGEAVLIGHEGHCYALLVESIEDAIEIVTPMEPLRATPAAFWARVARGIVAHDGETILVVSPGSLILGPGGASAESVNRALTPAL